MSHWCSIHRLKPCVPRPILAQIRHVGRDPYPPWAWGTAPESNGRSCTGRLSLQWPPCRCVHAATVGAKKFHLLSWSSEFMCPIWVGQSANLATRLGYKESLDQDRGYDNLGWACELRRGPAGAKIG
jgi:hypothetical protein